MQLFYPLPTPTPLYIHNKFARSPGRLDVVIVCKCKGASSGLVRCCMKVIYADGYWLKDPTPKKVTVFL